MILISICICTRRRIEGLKVLLKSIEEMIVPINTTIKIVVVENDSQNFTENIVKEFASTCKFSASYFLETRQGLAFARNRSVRESMGSDFCCFVDDDQVVDPDWLVELVKCQREFNADGVWGPNPPFFSKKVPSYIRQFHTPKLYDYGTIVTYASTNCLLLRKEYLDKIEGPFDLRLNFSGCEDIYLTYQITKIGGIIRYNANALAYENIPESRTTISYIIKRSFGDANASYFTQSLIDTNFSKFNAILRLSMRLSYGLLIMAPFFLFSNSNKLKGLIKIVKALGGFFYIFGKLNQFYKK